jgi:hypothetical protein
VCEGGARNPACLRAFHSPGFPPALAGGSPLGLGLFLRHRLRISFRLGQTGNRCVSSREGITVGALAQARGENHGGRARGENCKQRGKPQPRRGRVGALARARGQTRIKEGELQRTRRTREQKGILKEGGKSAGTGAQRWGPRASARGNLHTTGKLQRPRRTREQKGILKEGGKSAGTGAQRWGPRASARGNPVCEGGPRNPASLRAFHSPGFPPALAGGSPLGLGLFLRHRLRISFRLGQTGNRCVSSREGITVGALARARGEQRRQEGETAAMAAARLGPSRKREGKPAYNGETGKNAENPRAKGNSQGGREIRRPKGARLGPSCEREEKPGV